MKKEKRIEGVEFVTPTGQQIDTMKLSPRIKEIIFEIAEDLLAHEEGVEDWGHACICAFVIFLSETEGEVPDKDMMN